MSWDYRAGPPLDVSSDDAYQAIAVLKQAYPSREQVVAWGQSGGVSEAYIPTRDTAAAMIVPLLQAAADMRKIELLIRRFLEDETKLGFAQRFEGAQEGQRVEVDVPGLMAKIGPRDLGVTRPQLLRAYALAMPPGFGRDTDVLHTLEDFVDAISILDHDHGPIIGFFHHLNRDLAVSEISAWLANAKQQPTAGQPPTEPGAPQTPWVCFDVPEAELDDEPPPAVSWLHWHDRTLCLGTHPSFDAFDPDPAARDWVVEMCELARTTCQSPKLNVEFALPDAALAAPVEWAFEGLGTRTFFTVRSRRRWRFNDTLLQLWNHPPAEWRFCTLTEDPPTACMLTMDALPERFAQLQDHLLDSDSPVALVVKGRADLEELEWLLDYDTMILVWAREDPADPDGWDALLRDEEPSKGLWKEVHRLRGRARRDPDSLGRQLVLVWDDPTRKPPIKTTMNSPS